MDIDYLIGKLKEQRSKAHQSDIEVWLRTTYAFIEDYFKSYSSRASGFYVFINEHTSMKIYGVNPAAVSGLKRRALEYVDEIIQYLIELKAAQQKDANAKALLAKQQKPPAPVTITKTETKMIQAPPPPPIIKTQLPFGISGGLFWTIFAAFVAGAFLLGLYFGSSKFDREKSDYYDEVKSLRIDTTRLTESVKIKNDSLSLLKKNLFNLQTVLDSVQKREKKLN